MLWNNEHNELLRAGSWYLTNRMACVIMEEENFKKKEKEKNQK